MFCRRTSLRKYRRLASFSIIEAYLHLVAEGEKIAGFRSDGYRWRDLGKPEAVMETARELEEGGFWAQ